ncbi:MAG TPA: DNA polymerase III subunit delta [Propionibacteriaceae bacterium]|nr:DNA polymerase III subunit delta [Propionibacteriaceae bacterium]
MAPKLSPLGQTTLVSGPEPLLADRAVDAILAELRKSDPEVEVSEIEAIRLDSGKLAEMTSASLFSTRRGAVVRDLANLPAELTDEVLSLVEQRLADLALVLVHGGGPKGKGLLDKLKKARVQVIDCPALKAWELPQFVTAEVRRAGGGIEPAAARLLVDAVGNDLRGLASAVSQLLSDAERPSISVALVKQYFGGRSEVRSFEVADAALAGRTGAAMEQLRWAMSTGVAPVLVTSALASGLRGLGKLLTAGGSMGDADLAREIGVPPWKLKSMRPQARGWDQRGIAAAINAVAIADAEVKGASDDAEFALERALLAIATARRG